MELQGTEDPCKVKLETRFRLMHQYVSGCKAGDLLPHLDQSLFMAFKGRGSVSHENLKTVSEAFYANTFMTFIGDL